MTTYFDCDDFKPATVPVNMARVWKRAAKVSRRRLKQAKLNDMYLRQMLQLAECENQQLKAEIARLQNLRTFTDTEAAAHGSK